MRKWCCFGRVTTVTKNIRRKNRKEKIKVHVIFWLANWEAPYATGNYLHYETEKSEYKIYNPLDYAFDLNQLISFIRTWHSQNDDKVVSAFSIKESP